MGLATPVHQTAEAADTELPAQGSVLDTAPPAAHAVPAIIATPAAASVGVIVVRAQQSECSCDFVRRSVITSPGRERRLKRTLVKVPLMSQRFFVWFLVLVLSLSCLCLWLCSYYKTTTSTSSCTACPGNCASGQYRSGCGGSSYGSCVTCATNCGSGKYRTGCSGLSAGTCTNCGSCGPGTYRYSCSGLSAGSCRGCANK